MAKVTGFDYLTAFSLAADQVLTDLLGEPPSKDSPVAHFGEGVPIEPVTIGVSITGDLAGHVRLGMTEPMARAVASCMLDEDVSEIDEMALSALCELTNMIAGNARSSLNQDGLISDISPPSVLRGMGACEIWPNLRAISIPLHLSIGTLHLTVGVRPRS